MARLSGCKDSGGGKCLLLAVCSLFLLFAAGAAPRPSSLDPKDWSIGQWIQWRDEQIHRILSPGFDANGVKILSREDVISHCVDAYKVLNTQLNDPEFLADPVRAKELSHFVEFVKAQATMAIFDESHDYTHHLGFAFDDRQYWRTAGSELEFPALLRSAQFLRDLEDPATYEAAVELIRRNNSGQDEARKWQTLIFRSRFLKSVDKSTYGRLLVLVPNDPAPDGGETDRWIQFALVVPGTPASAKPRSVSMVAIHKPPSGSGGKRAFLSDFMRHQDTTTGEYALTPTMLEQPNPSKNCYDCHKSAVLPVEPRVEYAFDTGGRLVEKSTPNSQTHEDFNTRIAGYGKCDFEFMTTESYGPSIGPVGRERGDRLLIEATKANPLPRASFDRVRDAMNCSGCHDGFAKLNYPVAVENNQAYVSFEQKKGMIQTFIENGWMPPNNTLSTLEREALWKCLYKEYFDQDSDSGVLIEWLKGADSSTR